MNKCLSLIGILLLTACGNAASLSGSQTENKPQPTQPIEVIPEEFIPFEEEATQGLPESEIVNLEPEESPITNSDVAEEATSPTLEEPTTPELQTPTSPETPSVEPVVSVEPEAPAEEPCISLQCLNEEFDDPLSLSRLIDLNPAVHDIASIEDGHLNLSPTNTAETGWYSDIRSMYLYKEVSGNFVVEIQITVGQEQNPLALPRGQFNSAGLLIRDPASRIPSGESWIMYNMGNQLFGLAREAKTTRARNSGDSYSTFYLNSISNGPLTGQLRICRVDSTFYLFHRMAGQTQWTEETLNSQTGTYGNGMWQPTPGTSINNPIRFLRNDLPNTLQVGLTGGNWGAPFDTLGHFDYMRFREVNSAEECTLEIEAN